MARDIDAPRKLTRIQQVAGLVGAAGLVALIGLVGLEGLLRVLRPAGRFYPYHPSSVKVQHPVTPGVQGPSYFTTNSHGCRGPELAGQKHRMLVIGGSTAANTLLDDSESWPRLIMEKINARMGSDFLWVTNSGIDGKNSRHHLMHAKYLLPELPRIDHVMVYAGLNDVGLWIYRSEFDPKALDNPDVWDATIGDSFRVSNYLAPDVPLHKRLEIWRTAASLKAYLKTRQASQMRAKGSIVQDDQGQWIKQEQVRRKTQKKQQVPRAKMETFDAALASYIENLERIADLVTERGAQTIFVGQAIQWAGLSQEAKKRLWMGEMDGGKAYIQEEQMQKFVGLYNDAMGELAKRKNALYIPLSELVEPHGDIYYDGCHFDEEGSAIAADELSTWLLAKVYDPQATTQPVHTSTRATP